MHTISIIVPVYSVEKYIDRFLKSLDKQTFKDFEVIFVYDLSNDNSLKKLKEYQFENIDSKEDCKIIYNSEKKGVGFAKDLGFSYSDKTSKYVMFLDSDDYFDEYFLEKLYRKAEETQSDITCCGFLRIDEDTGEVLREEMTHNPDGVVMISDSKFPLFLMNISGWNKLYKRKVAENSLFGLSKHGEDLYYFLHAVMNSESFSFVSEPLYYYMVHQDSLISNLSYDKFENTLSVFETFTKNLEENLLSDLMSAFIFYRIGISTTLRVCRNKDVKRKRVLKESKIFLKKFNIFKKNKFLSFGFLVKNGKKGFIIWLLKVMIKYNLFGIVAGIYSKKSNSSKLGIRW